MMKLYNSLTKTLEEFKPLKKREVGIYVCGPTVYGPVHLGHGRTWIFFDWLRRYFELNKFKVKFVQNITDVGHLVDDADDTTEDKIEKEAKAQGKTPQEIAKHWEGEYFRDLESLNILKPDFSPKASAHIKEMVNFIKVLLDKGFAYEVSGNVYFDVGKLPSYGELSGRSIQEEKPGKRVKTDTKKNTPADFALWLKADANHLQKWPSPWSEGYPGWHLECSVMSVKFLGQPFDIHGGGIDNIFPHHENELAQSKAYFGKPLANFFLHAGTLLVSGQKMAKSLNNYITVKDALKENDADTLKIAMMNNHWRSPFNLSASTRGKIEDAISEAEKVKVRLIRAKEDAQPIKTGFPTQINQILENDFNVPRVLGLILENLSKLSRRDFEYIEDLFGLKLVGMVKLSNSQKKMIKARNQAREAGDYKKADQIRKSLKNKGIILEDTASGTRVLTPGQPRG